MANRTQLLVGVSAASVAAVVGVFLWRKWSSPRGKVGEVTQLYVYPIKSCHRIELKQSECNKRGLKYDRCWVVAREKEGQLVALTQTQYPKLAAVQPQLQPTADGKIELHITAPDMSPIIVPEELPLASTTIVSDKDMNGECQDVGDSAAQWFSKYLGIECRLYYMSPSHKPRYFTDHSRYGSLGKPDEETSFANTSSLLVTTENALDDLNSRVQTDPIPMNRFRPNVVVRLPEDGSATGGKGYPEDSWTLFTVGSVKLRLQRPCNRCFVTTINQDQGVVTGDEPLKTLRTYRMYNGTNKCLQSSPNGVFGMCCAVIEDGIIAVGDGVHIP